MKKKDNYVLSLGRKTRQLLLLVVMVWSSESMAQRIDFNNGTNSNYTASNFTAWSTGEITSGNTTSTTIDGVTITIGHGTDTQATLIKSNWYKNGVTGTIATDESKLVCDGIFAGMANDEYGGYGKTTGKVAISFTLTGLSAGEHCVQAYHNYLNGKGATLPTIGVAVNGVTQKSGIAQSQQVTELTASSTSYVTFTATEGESVTITYFSEPESGQSYTTTYFYINSLEIDVNDANNQAQSPSPADGDYHVDADGTLTLSWTAAANNPTSHVYYFGEDESEVSGATTGGTATTATSFTKSGLNPMQTYYWRVDEVIDGVTYKGTVWSFRPRRLAFPGADGAGKYAQGGRGGAVYHVTSLADDGSAGTLRYGLESLTGPRTIVFDVSGVIQLQSTLTCSDSYVTIAGQTAPGIGIMLRDQPFGSNSSDGITRFMRFRYGHGDDWDGTSANQNVGNAAGLSANYGIMDHCLLGWGSDETFSSRGAKNYSFQHNIIGESLNQNGHKNYWDENHSVQHGYAATVAGDVGSLHHNLLAHNEGRNWSLGGGLDGTGAYAGRLNIRDNVVYNWGGRATDGGVHEGNFVNNYYKKGPATSQNFIFIADLEGAGSGTQEYYLNGNLRVSQDGNTKTGDTSGDTYKYTLSGGQVLDWTVWASTAYSFWSNESNVESSAEAAFKNVLSDVGCNYASLDNNEMRLVEESLNGTYSKTGSRSGKAGLVDKESDSEGWDGLGITSGTRASDWDTDQDGIPDWFETANGWDASTANNNVYNTTTYYTNLEEYLNWMAEPHFIGDTEGEGIAIGVDKTIDLSAYFAGYTSPTYSISNSSGATASVTDGVLTVNAPASLAGQLFTVAVTATEGSIFLVRNFNFYVAAEAETEVLNEFTEGVNESYTLSVETSTTVTGTTDEWTFENGFTVSTSKGYAAGLNNCIKYSRNETFTINIPDRIEITKVNFTGYCNKENDASNTYTSYLSKLGTQTFTSTDYVFPARNAEPNSASYDITLTNPASGSMEFYPSGDSQSCFVITLYAQQAASLILKELATSYTPTAATEVTVTVKHPMSSAYWNTLCVPFDITEAQIKSVFGEGTQVAAFTKANGTSLHFDFVTSMEAGVPYLIKPTNTQDEYVFTGVEIKEVEAGSVSHDGYTFQGTYVKRVMKTDGTEKGMTKKNTLAIPSKATAMRGLRGFFVVPVAGQAKEVTFGNFDTSSITTIDNNEGAEKDVWYNLNGQRVEHAQHGVFIKNGRKVVVK